MTVDDHHGDLPSHGDVLLRRLDGLADLFAPAKVRHGQHMQYAERCRVLGDHLRGVLALSTSRHYAAAFALTRTALEHHLVDRLLFLASRRWEVIKTGIKPADAKTEEARLAALKAGSRADIVRWRYNPTSRTMHVLFRGAFRQGSIGRGWTLSPYYFRVDRYDPFTVHKKVSSRVAMGFHDQDSAAKWAAESLREWHGHFTFEKLRESLDLNHLLRPRLGVQMYVHYYFLSAFVHGVQKAYERVFSPNIPSKVGDFNHYASELALLYVVAIAAAELEVFGRMAKRPPRLRLLEWPAVEAEVATARAASSYFWFLSGEPTMYDRIQQVHSRKPILVGGRPSKRLRVDPASLRPSRVKYYADPLDRIKDLHQSSTEMWSGQIFQSPFDRADARFRQP